LRALNSFPTRRSSDLGQDHLRDKRRRSSRFYAPCRICIVTPRRVVFCAFGIQESFMEPEGRAKKAPVLNYLRQATSDLHRRLERSEEHTSELQSRENL